MRLFCLNLISFFLLNCSVFSQELLKVETPTPVLSRERLDEVVVFNFYPQDNIELLYGIAFDIRYNPQDLDTNSIALSTGSTFGERGKDYIDLYQQNQSEGLLRYAVTGLNENFFLDSKENVLSLFVKIKEGLTKDFISVSAHPYMANNHKGEAIPLLSTSDTIYIGEYSLKHLSKNTELYQFILYPNPTNGIVNIKYEYGVEKEIVEVRAMRGEGSVVRTTVPKKDIATFDLSFLPKGIYLIQTVYNDFIVSKKIILN